MINDKTTSVNTYTAVLEFIQNISGSLNDGVVIVNSSGNITVWNSAAERITGLSSGSAITDYIWNVADRLHPSRSGKNISHTANLAFFTSLLDLDCSVQQNRFIISIENSRQHSVILNCSISIHGANDCRYICIICSDMNDVVIKEKFTEVFSDNNKISQIDLNSLSRTNLSSLDDKKREEAFRIAAEKYSRTFHLAPISLSITAMENGEIIEVNDEFLRNTGYTRDELTNKTVLDINIWETPEERERVIAPVRQGVAVKNCEIIFRHKNGELHNYIFSAEPVRLGEVDCIVSNFFDITERKKLMEAVRISEEKFSRSFRLAPISISITTLVDGLIMEVNDEFLRNTGYRRGEIIGKTVFDINIWEPPDARNRIIPPLRSGRTVKNIEILFRHKNGDIHNYIYSAEPITLNGIDCIISIFFDITEKKKLEDALRISEEMYKTVFESTGSAMGIVKNDILVLVNNGMVELSGYSKKQMEGRMTWQEFVIPEYVKEIRKNSQALGADEASLINRSEFKLKDRLGNVKDVYCLTALCPDESQYVVTLIDMTEYNFLLTQINEISKREQQRVGELLHDNLIQYLTGISLLIRTLEIKMQSGKNIELRDIKKIHDLIGESLTLTKKLLKGLFLVEIDYEGLPSAMKNLAASVSELYDIACIFEDDCEVSEIDVMKATELYYIANEAVHNAVKHGHADEISVSLKNSGESIILEINDNGTGFTETINQNPGGLGLKLMKFRAKMIGAKIRIKNNSESTGVQVLCTLRKD